MLLAGASPQSGLARSTAARSAYSSAVALTSGTSSSIPALHNAPSPNQQGHTHTDDGLFVFVAIPCGAQLELAQIEATSLSDLNFLLVLGQRYDKARGVLRGWFSLWTLSHFEFYQVSLPPL